MNETKSPLNMKWCITCERWVSVDGEGSQETHFRITQTSPVVDGAECVGPFVLSEPPVLEDDWELNATEPSEAELAQMDLAAEELLAQVASQDNLLQ